MARRYSRFATEPHPFPDPEDEIADSSKQIVEQLTRIADTLESIDKKCGSDSGINVYSKINKGY